MLRYSPINRRNSENAYGRVLPVFLKMRFGQWLFGLRCEIERIFSERMTGWNSQDGMDFIDMH
jgi:hypothetical protein